MRWCQLETGGCCCYGVSLASVSSILVESTGRGVDVEFEHDLLSGWGVYTQCYSLVFM